MKDSCPRVLCGLGGSGVTNNSKYAPNLALLVISGRHLHTLSGTEGSAISRVYRHESGPTLGGYDSPVSSLTVRQELT